jgi:hypothetical protein
MVKILLGVKLGFIDTQNYRFVVRLPDIKYKLKPLE